jgi:hypothetical protein
MNPLEDEKLLDVIDNLDSVLRQLLYWRNSEVNVRARLPLAKHLCGKLSQKIYELDCKEHYKEDEYF